MSKPSENQWPRPYLLEIHEQAIDEGCCRVEGVTEQQARSLIQSFYRIRRRGDSQHKLGFIKPEYHLVMAMWESERGSVLFMYNALPDNVALPKIVSVPASERTTIASAALAALPEPGLEPMPDLDTELDALVAESLRRSDSSEN